MWNWGELKEASEADFSSVTYEQTRQFLHVSIRGARSRYLEPLKKAKIQKKRLVEDSYNWISYLKPSELMMLGDLDRKEAVDLYKTARRNKKDRPMFYSFEHCLLEKRMEHYDKGTCLPWEKYFASNYDDAIFVKKGRKNKKKKEKEIAETRGKLDSEERINMLAGCESYDMKLEQTLKDQMMRKKTEYEIDGKGSKEVVMDLYSNVDRDWSLQPTKTVGESQVLISALGL